MKYINIGDNIIKLNGIRRVKKCDFGNSAILQKNRKVLSYDIRIWYMNKDSYLEVEYDNEKTRNKFYNELSEILCK